MVRAQTQGQWAVYGAIDPQHLEEASVPKGNVQPPHFGRSRKKMNLFAIAVSLFLPWIIFMCLFADVSFQLHYTHPQLCWGFVLIAGLVVAMIGALAAMSISRMVQNSSNGQPTWLIFLFLTSLVALVLGPTLGNSNFSQNMRPYYDLQGLNDYSSVDPSRMRGEQMMDAGRVEFLQGASLDLRKAYAFQNMDTYCVVPITINFPKAGGPTQLSSYDFWAVGLNCCSSTSTDMVDFKCGASKRPTAREGLRFMGDEQRDFLRLAVQQAEAKHHIKAVHPLFFEWTEDSARGMHSYLHNAFKNFAIATVIFFAVQLTLVIILTYTLSKMGYGSL